MTFYKPGQIPKDREKETITNTAADILSGGGTGSGRPAGYTWTPKDYEARVKHKLQYAPAPEFKTKFVDTDNPNVPGGQFWVVYDKWENWRQPLKWAEFEGETDTVGFMTQQDAEAFTKNLTEALAAKPAGLRYILFKDENGNAAVFDAYKMELVFTDEGVNAVQQQKWLENDFHKYMKELASQDVVDMAAITDAINGYKDGEYGAWNGYLREGKMGTGANPHYETKIKYLDQAFQYKAPPLGSTGLTSDNEIPGDNDNVMIWRGLSGGAKTFTKWFSKNGYHYDEASNTFKDKQGNDIVGNAIPDDGFGSAAYVENFARSWGGGNYIHIKIDKGVHVINFNTSESERVLPRGATYQITKLEITKHNSEPGKAHKIIMHATVQVPLQPPAKKIRKPRKPKVPKIATVAAKTVKQGKENMDRFSDWAKAELPILPIDHPKVRKMIEEFGKYVTPRDQLQYWPDDPPTMGNMYFHKKGAKRGK